MTVMPWLFAEADGAKDVARMRALLAHGLAAGAAGGALYLTVAVGVWKLLPALLHLSAAEYESLRGPVVAMTLVTALGYPTRLLVALRLGLQDYLFMGWLSIWQTLLNLLIVVALTKLGAGLYGIALGAAIPPIVVGLGALLRTKLRNPELLLGWRGFANGAPLRSIVSSGAGTWLASLGWQLAFASDSVVIAYLGFRDLVPIFVITSRLGLTLMQLSWALPDSTSVGLAQLNAEGSIDRTRHVIATLLRLHLLAAGLIACCLLAGNLSFVTVWVGSGFYGGAKLNAALALNVIALSVVHSLLVPAAVLGRRVAAGLLTLLNGATHIGFALLLGHFWGMTGVAMATTLSALLTTIPGGLRLLTELTSLGIRAIARTIVLPWLVRMIPSALLAVLLTSLLLHLLILLRHLVATVKYWNCL